MNFLDFANKAGWPASSDTFEYLQNMILQLQQVSVIAGTNYIVSGCTVTGGNTQNGLLVINGEVLPFEGGPTQPNVVIIDTPTKKQFFGGAQNNYYHARKATFGNGVGAIAFNTLKRNDPANGVLERLDRVEKMLKPLVGYIDPSDNAKTVYGTYLLWNRPVSEIPDGYEAVPDEEWKGRVPVILDENQVEFNEVGKIGGEKSHPLTVPELPIHDHPRNPEGASEHYMKVNAPGGSLGIPAGDKHPSNATRTGSAGEGQAHNNLQPYKVVMFIRWVG
jgi:hypothetical protein